MNPGIRIARVFALAALLSPLAPAQVIPGMTPKQSPPQTQPAPAPNPPQPQSSKPAAPAPQPEKPAAQDDSKPTDPTPQVQPTEGGIIVTPISTEPDARAVKPLAAPPPTSGPTPAEVVASVKIPNQPIKELSRLTLIRGLEAEFVFVRHTFPFSEVGLTLKAGTAQVMPEGTSLRQEIAKKGAAAHPGDRGQITALEIRGNSIVFELNGGPRKKTKWYQRISIGGAGGEAPIAPGPDNTMAHGSLLTLQFDKFVPDLTVDQLKQLLAPVFDFSSKSATQAYADFMPPKTKQAIKDHKALVGMNREMVMAAKGRPEQKVREHDEQGNDYEEWIYGTPPAEVDFVRFVGDEVTQVKVMTVDGQRIVRTAREVDFPPGQIPGSSSAAMAQNAPPAAPGAQPAAQPGQTTQADNSKQGKPTLRRPGEEAPASTTDPNTVTVQKKVGLPMPNPPQNTDPNAPPMSTTPIPGGPPLPPPPSLPPAGNPPPPLN